MKKLLVIFLLLILSTFALAQEDTVEIYVFHSAGCPNCVNMLKFLDELEQEQPELKVTRYELRNNLELLFSFAEEYDLELTERVSIPLVFTPNKVFVGHSKEIEEAIRGCIKDCKQVGDIKGEVNTKKINFGELTIPAVVSAAAVDAINPCAFAVLIILLTTILATSNRKKALFAGLAFTAAIYISYFLMGLGLYTAVSTVGISHIFLIVVAILAIIVGLFNLKDYFWYGKWFIMEVPRTWRPRMKMLIKSVTSVPGAFFIGFIISLFLLPCTSGPYIVILGLLAKAATKNFAILLLLLYNLIFILPMLIITLAIFFGFTTTQKVEEWRTRKLKLLHLIAGIIMVLLGIGMFIAMWLGMI